jgi:heme-degrading monooxygenase HmoA
MHVRLITITGAARLDDGVDFIRETILPDLRRQNGFNSISVSADRYSGVFTVLSVWETEAARDASEGFSEKARSQAWEILGGELSVDRFEQVLWEVGPTPPNPGAKLHIRSVKMDPARVEENLDFFRQTVLPDIKATPGFLGVRQLIDRQSGAGRVGTVWADESSLKTALERAEARRPLGSARSVEFGDELVMDVLFRAE